MSLPSTRRTRVIPWTGAQTGKVDTRLWDYSNVTQKVGKFIRRDVTTADNKSALSSFNGSQVTDSVSHPEWRHRRQGDAFKRDVGGPFTTVKQYVVIQGNPGAVGLSAEGVNSGVFWDQSTYVGPMLPMVPTQMTYPTNSQSSESVLTQLGTTAISRCAPTNPNADLSVMLHETMKEGFPRLIGGSLKLLGSLTHTEARKHLGEEFLNVEFGWKPLVNDLKDISRSLLHAQSILDQYERDSGKLVRRRYEFPPTVTRKDSVFRDGVSPWINPSYGFLTDSTRTGKGQVILTEKTSRRQWFSGAFSYYVPPADGSLRTSAARAVIEARKLFGLSLTPDVIWNSAPWSWAFDWFANTSETLGNWASWAIDNQVLMYGYLMEHSFKSYTYTFVGPTGFKSSYTRPPVVEMVVETKLRRQATPYGFGISWNGMSPRQIAIAAALGLTR